MRSFVGYPTMLYFSLLISFLLKIPVKLWAAWCFNFIGWVDGVQMFICTYCFQTLWHVHRKLCLNDFYQWVLSYKLEIMIIRSLDGQHVASQAFYFQLLSLIILFTGQNCSTVQNGVSNAPTASRTIKFSVGFGRNVLVFTSRWVGSLHVSYRYLLPFIPFTGVISSWTY